jgi:hypothetical protein
MKRKLREHEAPSANAELKLFLFSVRQIVSSENFLSHDELSVKQIPVAVTSR